MPRMDIREKETMKEDYLQRKKGQMPQEKVTSSFYHQVRELSSYYKDEKEKKICNACCNIF